MEDTAYRAIAIVGVGAVLPDAPNAPTFWENIKNGRYSVTEVSPDRWDPALYYDPDPNAPDKTYSKIGGWVRQYPWDPIKWKLAIPPRVIEGMDDGQKWAIACTREALMDYGYPQRPLDLDRTAVILGNAMAGEKHYFTSMRIMFPEFERELEHATSFASLPAEVQRKIEREVHDRMAKLLPPVTEDTMPGELSNCIAGRIANTFNIHGPNYVCDAACASSMAAISSAVRGLIERDFDAAITGGVDRNMGATSFVKFCKIGALSATGTRPYAEGADGFVMGEGAAFFVLKRLADAERDGDKIYCVLRGMGGSSDGKGKGITAPNPVGQKFAIERGWKNAGLDPATAGLFEGHGTSTKVGDRVEAQSLVEAFAGVNLPKGSIALGSVKSNFGHLKSSAGAAGFLKVVYALRDKVLPPSVNFHRPNPDIDFAHSPLFVNTELRPWDKKNGTPRRAGLSAFGFGGTNFHAVFEEYIPGYLRADGNGRTSVTVPANGGGNGGMMSAGGGGGAQASAPKKPMRGALVVGGRSNEQLAERLRAIVKEAQGGRAPAPAAPMESDVRSPERVAIDYGDAAELAQKAGAALKALTANNAGMWKALRAQGIFRGHGAAPKVAFLYTGQGSQYVNMMKDLRAAEPIVAETFGEADKVLTHLLGKPLSEFIFINGADANAVAEAEEALRQTAITQPAVIATDVAMTRLLDAYGVKPDMVMGHSVGEYGALVASEGLPFADSMEAVSARGREMTAVSMEDNGKMAAVFAPLPEIERLLKTVDGYVVTANINSNGQAVIGGNTKAVEQAIEVFTKAGYNAVLLNVSHAFHTKIVAPASEPLSRMLQRLRLTAPKLLTVANINGEFYPTGASKETMVDILARQVAAPVQFVKGLQTLYQAGARVFVEVGPKKALQGFADDVLGSDPDVFALFTNHPKQGDIVSFNQALCGLFAAGLGRGQAEVVAQPSSAAVATPEPPKAMAAAATVGQPPSAVAPMSEDRYSALGKLFAEFIDRSSQVLHGGQMARHTEPVAITGAALGLPGTDRIFDDANVARILRGDQFIDVVPTGIRQAMLDKHITRVVKKSDGSGSIETINNIGDVIKLAARGRAFDLELEYGLSSERNAALDRVTRLAIAAGVDALRDAGIPLVMRYKTTSKGTQLPDRWMLPEELRDSTGVIMASAFPGYESMIDYVSSYHADHARHEQVAMLERLRTRVDAGSVIAQEIDRRIAEIRAEIEKEPYSFDRRFLFRVLSMGHSQFAEYIGARGPNTQINSACASTAQAVSLAEDWIAGGRCKRVVILSADDVTSDRMLEWFAAGFLASGAAATDEVVEDAATPFDRRRHGMIVGMGAAAMVVETAEAVRERGIQPICEVLSSVTANSAFHGTRLDIQHICQVMEELISQAEKRHGISRRQIAPQLMFMSHETYTPARGGSASAEIYALRNVFGDVADKIIIANTKGYTGHAMATGIEDVVAIKVLETGVVPPVPNFKEVDPELGNLNLSQGGVYPVEYAIHLGAGFGSQISMTLYRHVPPAMGARPAPTALGYAYRVVDKNAWNAWLSRITGYAAADLEVVNRTLRVKDQGAAAARYAKAAPEARTAPPPVTVVPPPPPPPLAKAAAASAGGPAAASVRAAAPVAPPAPSKPVVAADPVKEKILAIVAEKTGYPVDMLDLDLDLEADLGVDTVKQAEVFAAVREAYGIQRDDTIKLRDFPTLKHVIKFVHDRRPDLAAAAPVATAPAPQPTSAVAPPPAPSVVEDEVKNKVLEIVVEKTGYPKDMLDLELDLEADLGVDTVKQAELFAAIRGIYDIPRDENLKLRDFPTLAKVIQFVYDRRPDLKAARETNASVAQPPSAVDTVAASIAAPATTAPLLATVADDAVKTKVLDIVAEKTGYPKDMLDLDLDLEADLGVDTVKQAEVFALVRAAFDIPRDENLKLRDFPTLKHVIQFVYDKRPDLKAAAPIAAPTPVAVAQRAAAAPAPVPAPATTDGVTEKVLEIVAEKTGYPKDMLDLELDLEADLGVDTVKQAEVFALVRGAFDIPRDENLKLRDFPTLKHVIQFVYDKRPDLVPTAAPVAPTLTPVRAEAPVAQPPAAVAADIFTAKVLEIVAEKTGYPQEMLDLELDLEADLGIDTVKQAEMFASVRGAFNIPRDENLKLRDFPTLKHVIQFARERATGGAAVATAATPVARVQPARPIVASFEAADRIPRRVPVPVMRPALNLCKPTGVKFEAGSRVVVMPDKGGVATALAKKLKAMDVEVLRLDAAADAEKMTAKFTKWLKGGGVQGVFWLPGLDNEGPLNEMDPAAWHEAIRLRLKALYFTMRTLYEQVGANGTFLVSGVRLGGNHGYDAAGALAPLGGAVVGFTKTYKREKPECLCKAVDFEAERATDEIADLLIAETLRDNGAVEIGYKGGQRFTIGLQAQPVADGQPGLELNKDTVFLITGAAGSIVSAITADLAAASGGTFYLLDLVPEPDPNNPDLKRFTTDKDNLKRDLFARIQQRGERATPALVERELAALERAVAAHNAIEAVKNAGGTPRYFSVNLTDAEAVAKVIEQVRQQSGRIDVLLHAAGMERSHFLPDKDEREFNLVFDVKSDGWFNLLHAITDMPLAATVAFSSIAGRFGNGGQADYSSANDLLCKITSSFRTTRPATRGIAIDWTAWGGIGMATRGSIPKMMELAGIDMLPPEAGVPFIRRELTMGGTRGEVVCAQRLGIMLKEFDETGGLDLAALTEQRGPMAAKVAGMTLFGGLMVEATLDPKLQPFLFDHQIDGTPVLPGVMGIEAFAEAALAVLPGWHVAGIEKIDFHAPFKFYRNEPRTVSVVSSISAEGDALVADCKLIGHRQLPNQSEPQETVHFSARVRLTQAAPETATIAAPGEPAGAVIHKADVYRVYFHGPAYQVIECAWQAEGRIVGLMPKELPANHHPTGLPTVMAPRLIELCFQTAGLWEMGTQDKMGLPLHVDQVSLLRAPETAEGHLHAIVTPAADQASFDADVIDSTGNVYVRLRGYRTIALPNAVDSTAFKVLNAPKALQAVAD